MNIDMDKISNDIKNIGYIICENAMQPSTPVIMTSSKANRVIIKTPLQDADIGNRNKRMYPKPVLINGLNSDFIKERMWSKTFFGEAGHPLKPDLQRQLYLDQGNISHRVNEYWWEGNTLWGLVEAAATVRGNDFDGLVRQGCKVAFSLRAVGPIVEKRGDITVVLDPLTMFSYDWIIHPSHKIAYMDSVISEATNIGMDLCSESSVFDLYQLNEQESINSYIKSQSKNFKMISESFDINDSEMTLSEDMRNIYVKNNYGDTVVVKTEAYIANELSSYMKKF